MMFLKMGISLRRSNKKRKRRHSSSSSSSSSSHHHCVRADKQIQCDQQLFRALRCNHLAAIRRALQNGADANARMPYGTTALHHVVCNHSSSSSSNSSNSTTSKVVKALLQAGADPTIPNSFSDTALSLAAARGNCALVRLLLTTLDNATLQQLVDDQQGNTLLHSAAASGNAETVAEVMLHGADPLAQNRFGFTPMDYCTSTTDACSSPVRAHLLHYYQETVLDQQGPRALHHILRHIQYVGAAQQQEQDHRCLVLPIGAVTIATVLQLLRNVLAREPDSLVTVDDDVHGDLPLHTALRNRTAVPIPILQFLLRDDDTVITNGDGDGPLHVACHNPTTVPATLQWLLAVSGSTADVAVRDSTGALPLHLAARVSKSVDIVQSLVECFPQALQCRDYHGDLPLHEACRAAQSLAVVTYLVEQYPAAVRVTGRNGATPLHLACQAAAPSTAAAVIDYLVRAYPEALVVPTDAGDLPFMLVAQRNCNTDNNGGDGGDDDDTVDDASLDSLFRLLQANPSVLAFCRS